MATKVVMPQAGQDLETGKVTEWLKAEGDSVTKGESIVAIETEKISVEVEAPVWGSSCASWSRREPTTILSTIAIIGEAGEDISGVA